MKLRKLAIISLAFVLAACLFAGLGTGIKAEAIDAEAAFTAEEGASVAVVNQAEEGQDADLKLVFSASNGTGEEKTYTFTSKNDFWLPLTAVNYTATGATVKIGDAEEAYVSGAEIGGEEGGKLVITLTVPANTDAEMVVDSITTDGKELYTIGEAHNIDPNPQAIYIDADSFKFNEIEQVVSGYRYSNVGFKAYNGFETHDLWKHIFVLSGGATEFDTRMDTFITDTADKTSAEGEETPAPEPDKEIEENNYDATHGDVSNFVFYKNTDTETAVRVYLVAAIESGSALENTVRSSCDVTVTADVPDEAPVYKDLQKFYTETEKDDEGNEITHYEAYVNEIEANIHDADDADSYKYIGSSSVFNVPEGIYDYITSRFFSRSDLTYVIYNMLPGTETFTKLTITSSTKSFKLTALGEYKFYVLARDSHNEFVIDDEWVLGTRTFADLGWEGEGTVEGYFAETKDDAGNVTATELKVPVFRFNMGNRGPEVDSGSSSQLRGYIGSAYTNVSSFTVRGNDTTATYSLWYNPNSTVNYSKDAAGWYEISTEEGFAAAKAAGLSAKTEGWVDSQEIDILGWNPTSSSLSFTPVAEGTYVVVCEVSDGVGITATGNTKEIRVDGYMTDVVIDTTYIWFENNWRSVLFLGIALLSLVGIIVLLFVKPKEEKTED